MQAEAWAMVAGIALLALAAASSLACLAGRDRLWLPLTVALRGGSILSLATALYLAVGGEGGWSPLDLQQMVLSLALATTTAHLLLSLTRVFKAGNPAADVVAAVLVAAAWLAIRPGGASLTCLQRAAAYKAEWALFLSGAGGLLVAGSAALGLVAPGLPVRTSAWGLLRAGTSLAVLAIGAGILTGVWWTWQATGVLEAGTTRESWMAVVWLLAAMGAAAWQLEKRAQAWAAGLALAAAVAALLGLLGLPELQRLMGM